MFIRSKAVFGILAFLLLVGLIAGVKSGDLQFKLGEIQLKDLISALALLVSVSAFALSSYKDWRGAHGTVIKAFQGDDSAVAYIAYKVCANDLKKRFRYQDEFGHEVTTALIMAWAGKSSPQTKALIFAALVEIQKRHDRSTVERILAEIEAQYNQYRSSFPSAEADKQMEALHALSQQLRAK